MSFSKKISGAFAVPQNPFVYVSPSMHTIFICSLVFLLPQIVMLFITHSMSALFVISACMAASVLSEFVLISKGNCSSISVLVSVLQGIMIGFLLPQTYSVPQAFIITLSVLTLGKYVFGGFSSSWVNLIALTVAVAYLLNTVVFPDFVVTGTQLQEKNALMSLIRDGVVPMNPFDEKVSDFLNKKVFHFIGMEIPYGYVSLFWDSGSAIPAFRFNLLTLVSSLILFSAEMQDMVIPFVFAVIYGLLIHFAPVSYFISVKIYGDLFLAFLTSGVLFSTLFLLQWYGTVPSTYFGKFIYGVLAGVAAFVIIGYGASSIGYVFVVLLMNFISIFIQSFEMRNLKIAFKKNIRPRLDAMKEIQIV